MDSADVVLEVVWVFMVYIIVYKLIEKVLTCYHEVFQVMFNISLRYHYFNRESDTELRHQILHFFAALMSFALLSLNPLLRTLVYSLYGFVHITEINRLLLVIAELNVLNFFNLLDYTSSFDRRKLSDWFKLGVLFSSLANFRLIFDSRLSIIVFHLIDLCKDLDRLLVNIDRTLGAICTGYNIEMFPSVTRALVFFKSYRWWIEKVAFGYMTVIFVANILFSEDHFSSGNCLFYYYGSVRLFYLWNRQLKETKQQ